MERRSGILLPLSALPSPYGIGSLGKAAFAFVDFLEAAGQTWWQMLPVGPTSIGDSPYQSPSTYAGNPYFIDLDLLVRDGLLTQAEIDAIPWGDDPGRVDYGLLYENRLPLLEKALRRGWDRDREQVAAFTAENETWLPDYALFMALKRRFDMASWVNWPDRGARLRDPETLDRYRRELAGEIRFFTYLQYLFFRQWEALRTYARSKGVRILGDLPIYMAMDSADVWAHPDCFQLGPDGIPREVAGVPPDAFAAQGQLWGNPLYDYEAMAQTGYEWWLRRIGGAETLYDAIRIDHFRGFESYWAVPYGETTARKGRWVKGPGMALVGKLKSRFPRIQFIAEDLGYPSQAVRGLLDESGFPGMKVLQFAFDSRDAGDYLPHSYTSNCVCYTGTHDNSPLLGWREGSLPEDLAWATDYLGLNEAEGFVWGMLRGGMSSVADLFIAQMQDYLELDNRARMNVPGTSAGNWTWRMLPGQIPPGLADRLARMTERYGRRA